MWLQKVGSCHQCLLFKLQQDDQINNSGWIMQLQHESTSTTIIVLFFVCHEACFGSVTNLYYDFGDVNSRDYSKKKEREPVHMVEGRYVDSYIWCL